MLKIAITMTAIFAITETPPLELLGKDSTRSLNLRVRAATILGALLFLKSHGAPDNFKSVTRYIIIMSCVATKGRLGLFVPTILWLNCSYIAHSMTDNPCTPPEWGSPLTLAAFLWASDYMRNFLSIYNDLHPRLS
jgi:hypothetical protein